MNAIDITKSVYEVYAGCQNYLDVGRVLPETWLGISLPQSSFRTAFSQPGHFAFEWSDGVNRHLIWSNETGVFEMPGEGTAARCSNVRLGMAHVMGISRGSVDNLLPILLGLRGQTILDLEDLQLVLDSSSQHLVSGRSSNSEVVSISVEKDTFFIRAVSREHTLSPDSQERLRFDAEQNLYRLRETGQLTEERFQEILECSRAECLVTDTDVICRTIFQLDEIDLNSQALEISKITHPTFLLDI